MRNLIAIRVAVSVLATPFLIIAYLNVEKWAEKHGYDQFLLKFIDTIAQKFQGSPEAMHSAVPEFLYSPVMQFASASALAFVAGLWVDHLLRRREIPLGQEDNDGAAKLAIDTGLPPEIQAVIDDQAELIDGYLRDFRTWIQPHLDAHEPYLDFRFQIKNHSVYSVTYEDFDGQLFLNDEPFGQRAAMVNHPAAPIRHFADGEFMLRQFIGSDLRDLLINSDDLEIELAPSQVFGINFSFTNRLGEVTAARWSPFPRLFRVIREGGAWRFSIS